MGKGNYFFLAAFLAQIKPKFIFPQMIQLAGKIWKIRKICQKSKILHLSTLQIFGFLKILLAPVIKRSRLRGFHFLLCRLSIIFSFCDEILNKRINCHQSSLLFPISRRTDTDFQSVTISTGREMKIELVIFRE
jgi:hypothetical protein